MARYDGRAVQTLILAVFARIETCIYAVVQLAGIGHRIVGIRFVRARGSGARRFGGGTAVLCGNDRLFIGIDRRIDGTEYLILRVFDFVIGEEEFQPLVRKFVRRSFALNRAQIIFDGDILSLHHERIAFALRIIGIEIDEVAVNFDFALAQIIDDGELHKHLPLDENVHDGFERFRV